MMMSSLSLPLCYSHSHTDEGTTKGDTLPQVISSTYTVGMHIHVSMFIVSFHFIIVCCLINSTLSLSTETASILGNDISLAVSHTIKYFTYISLVIMNWKLHHYYHNITPHIPIFLIFITPLPPLSLILFLCFLSLYPFLFDMYKDIYSRFWSRLVCTRYHQPMQRADWILFLWELWWVRWWVWLHTLWMCQTTSYSWPLLPCLRHVSLFGKRDCGEGEAGKEGRERGDVKEFDGV